MFHDGAQSTYRVVFERTTWLGYAYYQQGMMNEVAVFPSVELAQTAYDQIKSGVVGNVVNPNIGDESYHVGGVGQSIVFRKVNVVVLVGLTYAGDNEGYAEICESRINSTNTSSRPSSLPLINSFTATPSTITTSESSTLQWNITGANSITISPNVGNISTSSTTIQVSPSVTTTYTISATNGSGTKNASVTITVTVPTPTTELPVISSFTANPTSINTGQSSTLQWNVTGATSVSLNQGIGTIASSGTEVVSPAATITYTISATNSSGTKNASVTITVSVPTPTTTLSYNTVDTVWQKTTNYKVEPGAGITAYPVDDSFWTWTSTVWDGPSYEAGYWAKWICYGKFTHYWFKTTLNISDIDSVSEIRLVNRYNNDIISINDDIYVYVNGQYAASGGTALPFFGLTSLPSNFVGAEENSIAPETGWNIQGGLVLPQSLFNNGSNTITVLVEDFSYWEESSSWGGMGHLVFKLIE